VVGIDGRVVEHDRYPGSPYVAQVVLLDTPVVNTHRAVKITRDLEMGAVLVSPHREIEVVDDKGATLYTWSLRGVALE
jgi:hypothetical protein